jgi:chemotaxis protein CheC
MANMLRRPLEMSLPQVIRSDGGALFELSDDLSSEAVVLFLYINFAVSDRDIRGYIAMLMDLPSLDTLRGLINEFISRVLGDEV